MIAEMEKRREEVNSLLNATQLISQGEMQKPFEKINLDTIVANLNKITQLYQDFPDHVARAKEMLTNIQDVYVNKKIAFLEAKAAAVGHLPRQSDVSQQMRQQHEQLNKLEKTLDQAPVYVDADIETIASAKDKTSHYSSTSAAVDWNQAFDPGTKSSQMLGWIPVEKDLYNKWSMSHDNSTLHNYYQQQLEEAAVIRGIVEPYQRAVRTKPGDYILVSKGNNLPVAYLYSTQVDLQDYVGKEITMRVSPRPNNHFAFPAYFVLAIE
jgi:hypothetical protein